MPCKTRVKSHLCSPRCGLDIVGEKTGTSTVILGRQIDDGYGWVEVYHDGRNGVKEGTYHCPVTAWAHNSNYTDEGGWSRLVKYAMGIGFNCSGERPCDRVEILRELSPQEIGVKEGRHPVLIEGRFSPCIFMEWDYHATSPKDETPEKTNITKEEATCSCKHYCEGDIKNAYSFVTAGDHTTHFFGGIKIEANGYGWVELMENGVIYHCPIQSYTKNDMSKNACRYTEMMIVANGHGYNSDGERYDGDRIIRKLMPCEIGILPGHFPVIHRTYTGSLALEMRNNERLICCKNR